MVDDDEKIKKIYSIGILIIEDIYFRGISFVVSVTPYYRIANPLHEKVGATICLINESDFSF